MKTPLRLIRFFTVIMLTYMSYLFYVKMSPIFLNGPDEKFISYNQVSGIGIFVNGTEYILNFDQQNHFLRLLNKMENYPCHFQENLDFEKIIIYRFDQPDLIIPKNNVDFVDTLCLNNF